jgi:hypothetical protein
MRIAILLGFILACIACNQAYAHPKTDVIVLNNGDTITGEIKSLYAGRVDLSTNSMGRIQIEWQDIVAMSSNYTYEIRTSDGSRYIGTLAMSSQSKLSVQGRRHSLDVPSLDVVELRPVSEDLKDQLDAYFSAGYSYDKASAVTQTNINTTIGYETDSTRNQFSGRATSTETDKRTTSSTKLELSRQIWLDKLKLFRTLSASYEKNDELSLDHRVSAGFGWGKYFIDNRRMSLAGTIGIQGLTEQQISGEEVQSAEGFLSGDFRMWQFNSPELDLKFQANLFPGLTETGRLRGDTNITLRWELFSDLFWDVSAWATYDNRTETGANVDYGITTGVGWEY